MVDQNMELKKVTYNKKRQLNCKLSTLLKNKILKKGKNTAAQKIWNDILLTLKSSEKSKRNTLFLIANVFTKLAPNVDLRKIRLGRNTVEVPFPIKSKRKIFLSFKWVLEHVQTNQNQTKFSKKLSTVFIEILKGNNEVLKKKEEWQKRAKQNARFLRYRWF